MDGYNDGSSKLEQELHQESPCVRTGLNNVLRIKRRSNRKDERVVGRETRQLFNQVAGRPRRQGKKLGKGWVQER